MDCADLTVEQIEFGITFVVGASDYDACGAHATIFSAGSEDVKTVNFDGCFAIGINGTAGGRG